MHADEEVDVGLEDSQIQYSGSFLATRYREQARKKPSGREVDNRRTLSGRPADMSKDPVAHAWNLNSELKSSSTRKTQPVSFCRQRAFTGRHVALSDISRAATLTSRAPRSPKL